MKNKNGHERTSESVFLANVRVNVHSAESDSGLRNGWFEPRKAQNGHPKMAPKNTLQPFFAPEDLASSSTRFDAAGKPLE